MDKSEYLSKYAEGWSNGDEAALLESLDDNYYFDDPNTGSIPKGEIAGYLVGLKEHVQNIRSGPSSKLMEISEILTKDEGGILTVSCWWAIPGTPIEGTGLIKVGDAGVLSERIAYYTKLPES